MTDNDDSSSSSQPVSLKETFQRRTFPRDSGCYDSGEGVSVRDKSPSSDKSEGTESGVHSGECSDCTVTVTTADGETQLRPPHVAAKTRTLRDRHALAGKRSRELNNGEFGETGEGSQSRSLVDTNTKYNTSYNIAEENQKYSNYSSKDMYNSDDKYNIDDKYNCEDKYSANVMFNYKSKFANSLSVFDMAPVRREIPVAGVGNRKVTNTSELVD